VRFSPILVVLLLACAPTPVPTRVDEVVTHPSAPAIAPFTTCTVTTATEPAASRNHLAVCSAVEYPFVPPSSGDHYALWADFETYTQPVPWGFLVHDLEHGAIVLLYDPSSAAATDIQAAFASAIAAHGMDPICRDQSWPSRFVVAPATDLNTPIAALAWEHTYEATCLDPPSLTAFIAAHYGQAPEALCAPGANRSSMGWCP
jgi:hypothetical protein